ncbi:MAG: hypothetical protein A4E53_00936 [Pelotomaculum sp. PtaB.Bin104]|nr:MAG: hypothetical protein A4E53_00936 [Pelotomaculum sp. PtaB.Bin104]
MRRIILILAVVFLLMFGAAAALALYAPGYFTGLALDWALRSKAGVDWQLPGEAGRPGAGPGAGKSAGDLPRDGTAGTGHVAPPAEILSLALAEQRDKLAPPVYSRYDLIVSKYQGEFSAQQEEYERELNKLLASALQDYRLAGSNSSSLLKIYERYAPAGKALESSCDSRFYNSLAEMEAELQAESLPTGVVEQAGNSYLNLKSERRQQLINMAKEKLQS